MQELNFIVILTNCRVYLPSVLSDDAVALVNADRFVTDRLGLNLCSPKAELSNDLQLYFSVGLYRRFYIHTSFF